MNLTVLKYHRSGDSIEAWTQGKLDDVTAISTFFIYMPGLENFENNHA